MECKTGIVQAIRSDEVDILISRSSACADCHAKGACTSQDRKDQLITVSHFPATLQVGECVRVVGKPNSGLRAVLFAFVIPILLVVISALILSYFQVGDTMMALFILAILVLYSLVLVALRPYFKKSFALYAEHNV